jgi:hypothetical protein
MNHVTNKTLRGVRPKSLADVYSKARDAGCELTLTGRNHVRAKLPDGRVVFGPLTSGSPRSGQEVRSQLRRYGVEI